MFGGIRSLTIVALALLVGGCVAPTTRQQAIDPELAAREAECCSFLSIETSRTDDSVRLEITSEDPNASGVIEMLTGAPSR